jgi:ArsR family transcriptional regulator, arsenate/arsenite/antimonite-responsive transcriptional repressor
MKSFMAISKALSDEPRVRILMALSGGELCVCQIVELLKLAPSTVSKHLFILHQARLIDSRKEKRWVYYSIARENAPREAREAIAWLKASLKISPRIKEDVKSLARICRMDPEELCRIQSAR